MAIQVPLVSIVVRWAMSVLKLRVGRSIGSRSLVADAWNDTMDSVGAAVAIVAVGLARYDPSRFLAADHYGGFAIGLLVVITGVRVVRDASFQPDGRPSRFRVTAPFFLVRNHPPRPGRTSSA
jgi:divalent metal cation (Fe/Co/Zn/Cd) transporter